MSNSDQLRTGENLFLPPSDFGGRQPMAAAYDGLHFEEQVGVYAPRSLTKSEVGVASLAMDSSMYRVEAGADVIGAEEGTRLSENEGQVNEEDPKRELVQLGVARVATQYSKIASDSENEWPPKGAPKALPKGTGNRGSTYSSTLPQEASGSRLAPKGGSERHKGVFGLRDARLEDIPDMVEIDMRSFSKVYQGYGQDSESLRAELTDKFYNRYRLLGGKWMPVVTRKGEDGEEKVVGFTVGCRTSKQPDSFVSWEETTDNGTLDSLYDPHGRNMYVVTLSMDPSVKGQRGQDQLFVRLLSSAIEEGIELAFFESRMPGLKSWVKRECDASGQDFDRLTDEDMADLADRYSRLTREVNGKTIPYDPLLRLYTTDFGGKLIKVLPNAYRDEPSMNFGALYTIENPLMNTRRIPAWLRNSKLFRKVAGKSVGQVAKSTKLTNKLVRLV